LDFSDVENPGKAVHVVVISSKEGSEQTPILGRKVPLMTIKIIASSLRDDWIVSDHFLPAVFG
jgi:hypothetical protein